MCLLCTTFSAKAADEPYQTLESKLRLVEALYEPGHIVIHGDAKEGSELSYEELAKYAALRDYITVFVPPISCSCPLGRTLYGKCINVDTSISFWPQWTHQWGVGF